MASMALGGPPRAPGDFQEALLENMESAKPIGVILILTMAKGDRPVTEVHPCHHYALLSIGNMISQCNFILLPFYERLKAGVKRPLQRSRCTIGQCIGLKRKPKMSLAIVHFGHPNQRGLEQELTVGWKPKVAYVRNSVLTTPPAPPLANLLLAPTTGRGDTGYNNHK